MRSVVIKTHTHTRTQRHIHTRNPAAPVWTDLATVSRQCACSKLKHTRRQTHTQGGDAVIVTHLQGLKVWHRAPGRARREALGKQKFSSQVRKLIQWDRRGRPTTPNARQPRWTAQCLWIKGCLILGISERLKVDLIFMLRKISIKVDMCACGVFSIKVTEKDNAPIYTHYFMYVKLGDTTETWQWNISMPNPFTLFRKKNPKNSTGGIDYKEIWGKCVILSFIYAI